MLHHPHSHPVGQEERRLEEVIIISLAVQVVDMVERPRRVAVAGATTAGTMVGRPIHTTPLLSPRRLSILHLTKHD